uniref:Bacterial repeat domain-containing protein n=1 Tax=viral metagenome TaxID=1070528 RepID=A0A6M3L256_9ZZZZ
MKTENMLIAGGVAAVALGAGILLLRGGAKVYLTIAEPLTGTTDPAPGDHLYNVGETVLIKAIPGPVYPYVQAWTVDGASKGTDESIYVTMNMDHRVTVTFTSDNPPPERIPASILNLTAEMPASVSLKQPFHGYWELLANRKRTYLIYPYDADNFLLDRFTYREIQFKVVDPYGLPVGNAPVYVNVAQTNDYNNGRLYIADTPSSPTNPILMYSDAQGIVKVPVAYHHEAIWDFVKEHMIFERHYWFGLTKESVCIQLGTEYYIPLYCTDIITAALTGSCPECNPIGQCISTEEFETAPTYNIITAYYAENSNVKNFCQFSTWLGIKHAGDKQETQEIVEPPGKPLCTSLFKPVYYIDEGVWRCTALAPLPSCNSGQFIAYSEADGYICLP